eukprot:gene636-693_t
MEEEILRLRQLIASLAQEVQELKESRRFLTTTAATTTTTESLNDGDTAWMLACSALVLFMTLPGLFLFYGGMARTKNVLAIIMQVVSTACLITFLWLCFGYSLAFAPAHGNNPNAMIFGDRSRFWLYELTLDSTHQLAPTIPESVFCVYELTFAIITPCLMVGAFADRMKFPAMLLLVTLWHLLVYCPTAHSIWHPNGFLHKSGALDFAGGNVVHITAGMSGLMTCIYLGPRIGFGVQTFETHNVMLTAVGACMLWVGWYGFNAGSSMGADDRAGFAMLVTQISTSISGLTWMLTECLHKGHPSVLGLVSGVVAGLVCVTPASGYVDQTGGFVIGLVAGPICYLGVQLKHWAGYDDALDAFGVHGVGGIVGGLMLGFFANDRISGRDNGVFYSDTYNGGKQLANQLYAIVVTVGWSTFMTMIILIFVDLTIGVRVSEDTEDRGDAVLFGATLVTETSNDNAAIGSIELHGQSVHPKNRN